VSATPTGRALRLVGPALAAALLAAGGGSLAAPARAGDPPPCEETAPTTVPAPCAEPDPAPPTTTETTPAGPSTRETETDIPTLPQHAVDTGTSPAPTDRSTPSATTTTATPPPTASTSGGIFGGGTRIALPPQSGTPTLSGGPYVFPVVGVTSFSDTWGAARATVAWHHGVDIFAPFGAPVVAVADGTVFSVGWNTVGGRRLWLRDREGNYFYYAHLSAFSTAAVDGAYVRAGTVVGYVGNTGDAEGTPYHLHFEIHPVSLLSLGYDGAVNPFSYVSSWRRLASAFEAHLVAGSSAAAPAAGAILIGFTDISSADGLSPEPLERSFEDPAVAEALAAEAARSAAAPSVTIAPPREDEARIARTLDSEATRPARYAASVWDALADCESGGDWGTNTGNGFVGGLQFLPQTWQGHGGGAFAPSANLATREQQIAIAARVLDSQGWGAWPACSAMLGLRALERE
jgi:murein DD-endopeptidase MepM/ murein hydrolase activator NlpD